MQFLENRTNFDSEVASKHHKPRKMPTLLEFVLWKRKLRATSRIEKYILAYVQNSKHPLTVKVIVFQTVAFMLNNMTHKDSDYKEQFK